MERPCRNVFPHEPELGDNEGSVKRQHRSLPVTGSSGIWVSLIFRICQKSRYDLGSNESHGQLQKRDIVKKEVLLAKEIDTENLSAKCIIS